MFSLSYLIWHLQIKIIISETLKYVLSATMNMWLNKQDFGIIILLSFDIWIAASWHFVLWLPPDTKAPKIRHNLCFYCNLTTHICCHLTSVLLLLDDIWNSVVSLYVFQMPFDIYNSKSSTFWFYELLMTLYLWDICQLYKQ